MIHLPSAKVEFITVAKAYDELTDEAFAIWIRMHFMPEEVVGQMPLAKELNKSPRQLSVKFRELKEKGYMHMASPGLPAPTTYKLVKRGKIGHGNRFLIIPPRKPD